MDVAIKKTAGRGPPRSRRNWKLVQSAWRHPLATLVLLAGLLLLGFGIHAISGYVSAEYHYRAALRELEQSVSAKIQDHLAQAQAHLALCLKVRPDSLEATFLAARTARRLLNYREAAEYLDRYQKLEGVREAWTLEQALTQAQQGDLEYANYLWSCVQKEHPDRVLILEALVRGFMQTYQYRSADGSLRKWLELQPNALQAFLWLGKLHRTRAEYVEAIADFGRALELDPECDEARLNLAEVLIYTHKAREALQHFDILAMRLPGNVAAVLGQGRCKVELSETEEARKLFDRLVRIKPDDSIILAESGKLLLNSGQVADAEARLRQALRVAPHCREALYSMYRCMEQQGKKAEAQKYLEQCNRVEKDLDQCKALGAKIMEGDNNPALRCEMARILMRNGQEGAKRWLDDAIRVDPKYRETYLLYAEYYEHAGQPELAARCRQHADKLAPASK